MGSGPSCPRVNTTIPENGAQWSLSDGKWGNVKLGWLISGISMLITTIVSMHAAYRHARHYHRPREQRQIIRILWMPLVFSIISFFSYRYYRAYIYYKLIFIVYESFCLTAFLALMLAYIGSSNEEQMKIMQDKDKRPLPWPFGCVRYRPSKPYFLYALNGSVLQYAFARPLISIIAMICESRNVLCAHKLSPRFAHLYLEIVDFLTISIALYGLIVLYTLVKERLEGKRPMTKFVVIKLVVAVTYYQAFLFSAMVSQGMIKENAYWSKSNIADGLNAMVICVEMVIVSGIMYWAYPATDYIAITVEEGLPRTKPWRAFGQALNYWDFVREAWRGILYFKRWHHNRGKGDGSGGLPEDKGSDDDQRDTNLDINAAFNRKAPMQYDMGEVSYRRSQSLAHWHSKVSDPTASYLRMDDQSDDYASKVDPETAVERSRIITRAETMPSSPSSYRPSSLYRTRFATRSATAPGPLPISSATPAPDLPAQPLAPETNQQLGGQSEISSPVYRSLMTPRDLTAMRQSVGRQSLSATPSLTEGSMIRQSQLGERLPLKQIAPVRVRRQPTRSSSRESVRLHRNMMSEPKGLDAQLAQTGVDRVEKGGAAQSVPVMATTVSESPDSQEQIFNDAYGSGMSQAHAEQNAAAETKEATKVLPSTDNAPDTERPNMIPTQKPTLPETGHLSPLKF